MHSKKQESFDWVKAYCFVMAPWFLTRVVMCLAFAYRQEGFRTKDSFTLGAWFNLIGLWSTVDLYLNRKKRIIGCWYTIDRIYYIAVAALSLGTEAFYTLL